MSARVDPRDEPRDHRRAETAAGVARLDALPAEAAERELLDCCGSRAWARRMVAARPFADRPGLEGAAERAFAALRRADWLEALAAHPRIGAAPASGRQSERAATWSAGEQAKAGAAERAMRTALARGNRRYEERFGHRYVVCAAGRSAEELLALLEARLAHEPEAELAVAAGEQRRITALRLARLLATEER
jgi:OHCU decarboxylase